MDGDGRRWTIGELARATGLTVRALRHYEAIGLLSPVGRTPRAPLRDLLGRLQAASPAEPDDRLTTLEVTGMLEPYLTQQQRDELSGRRAEMGEDADLALRTEWLGLLRTLYRSPPCEEPVFPLAWVVVADVGRVLIVGAGPCGIASARALLESGHEDFLVVEARDEPGGLAGSSLDAAGFTWDRGGHVVFSHYGEFDRLVTEVMGDDVAWHDRSAFAHVGGRFVRYPFQNNLHELPPDIALSCIIGLVEAQTTPRPVVEDNFGTWMVGTFGKGIVEHFMRPYNEKVWACPGDIMGIGWIADRVSVVDWRRALERFLAQASDGTWGPNSRFAVPQKGGTGEIFRRACRPLGGHIRYGDRAVGIHAGSRQVYFASGRSETFAHLIWTGPLDMLVEATRDAPSELRAATRQLVHTSVTVVGIGYRSPLRDRGSWFYFPDPSVPFYRVTNFAAYAPANVPGSDVLRYSSYIAEVARAATAPVPGPSLIESVDEGLRRVGLVDRDAAIVTVHVDDIPYAYPVPTTGRDDALAMIHPWLDGRHVYARGRFGSWRYEHGNMDHAVKMGIDVVGRILDARPEELWRESGTMAPMPSPGSL